MSEHGTIDAEAMPRDVEEDRLDEIEKYELAHMHKVDDRLPINGRVILAMIREIRRHRTTAAKRPYSQQEKSQKIQRIRDFYGSRYPKGTESAEDLRIRLIGALAECTTLREECIDAEFEARKTVDDLILDACALMRQGELETTTVQLPPDFGGGCATLAFTEEAPAARDWNTRTPYEGKLPTVVSVIRNLINDAQSGKLTEKHGAIMDARHFLRHEVSALLGSATSEGTFRQRCDALLRSCGWIDSDADFDQKVEALYCVLEGRDAPDRDESAFAPVAWVDGKGLVRVNGRPPSSTQELAPLTHVACRDEAGHIWSLPRPFRHHHVLKVMHDHGVKYESGSTRLTQGFLDANGRYLNRTEALVNAQKHNQIKGDETIASILTSEDLW